MPHIAAALLGLIVMLPIALTVALPVAAQDAAAVARRVHDERVDADALVAAIRSADPLTRAIAARVALVRDVSAALPALREMLAKETHHDAAREQMRAIVLLGSDDDVAFAAQQLARHPQSIDGEFGDTISRIGGKRGLDLYFRHARHLRVPAYETTLMFRGHESLVPAAAARALEAKDFRFFRASLERIADEDLPLTDEVALAALRHESEEVRVATLWHIIQRDDDAPPVSAAVRAEGGRAREGAGVEEALARELVRRSAGEAAKEVAGVRPWLAAEENRQRVSHTRVERLLTAEERKAAGKPRQPIVTIPEDNPHTAAVDAPAFLLPINLPAGSGDALLRASGCRGGWLGVAAAKIDRAGRVTALNTTNVEADPACAEALRTAARLTLAEPTSIRGGDVAPVLFVRDAGMPPCFDQAPLVAAPVPPSTPRSGGDVTAPKASRRVEPVFPENVRRAVGPGQSAPMLIETTISSTGCFRTFRFIRQSRYPELNRSALEALSKWKFAPGALNGVPVDVIFYLTFNFKSR